MDERLDLLLRALADRTRRALLDRLRDRPGQTLGELLQGFAATRQAVSKHLAVLEEAELVVPVWRGREKLHYLNPAPLQELPARWVTASAREERSALGAMQRALGETLGAAMLGPPAVARQSPSGAGHVEEPGLEAAADPVRALLQVAPSPRLQGQPVLQDDALQAARDYLAGTADAVRALVRALGAAGPAGEAAVRARPAAGGFSLVEHLWHLADVESLGWRLRFERILAEVRPRLAGVDGDRLAVEGDYAHQPWRGAARRFVAERGRSLALLRGFDAAALRRPVFFAGTRTRAGGVVAAAVAHDLEHRQAMALLWPPSQPDRTGDRR